MDDRWISDAPHATAAGLNTGLVFRLGDEWLVLDSRYVREVTRLGSIHSLPQRRNAMLKGLVNVNGELQVCIALEQLLQLEKAQQPDLSIHAHLICVADKDQHFAFAVSEVSGIHQFSDDEVELVPATVSRFRSSFTLGMLGWHEQEVGILDHELLFDSLARSLQ